MSNENDKKVQIGNIKKVLNGTQVIIGIIVTAIIPMILFVLNLLQSYVLVGFSEYYKIPLSFIILDNTFLYYFLFSIVFAFIVVYAARQIEKCEYDEMWQYLYDFIALVIFCYCLIVLLLIGVAIYNVFPSINTFFGNIINIWPALVLMLLSLIMISKIPKLFDRTKPRKHFWFYIAGIILTIFLQVFMGLEKFIIVFFLLAFIIPLLIFLVFFIKIKLINKLNKNSFSKKNKTNFIFTMRNILLIIAVCLLYVYFLRDCLINTGKEWASLERDYEIAYRYYDNDQTQEIKEFVLLRDGDKVIGLEINGIDDKKNTIFCTGEYIYIDASQYQCYIKQDIKVELIKK